ncbi:TIR domain-containing protein [Sphingomicrobium flavum]|uniref:TIR domain-containing protein n=1 Tax=Sphingomicrobium flavum TaxID=1229164 RepID=UPI0021AD8B16|nr:TIR domain-containing protein [Sphingomicrobium flavum]
MADIFLSYAREDRAIAERLGSAIEAAGKSVWWDRHIKGGSQFSKDIERELHAATHVLVLWSAASVESRWVRDEASHAADAGHLIGATIDGTPAPLGFGQFHTVDLQGWGETGAALPADLAEALDAEPVAPVPQPASSKSKKPFLIAGSAVALALAGGTYVAVNGIPGSTQQQSQSATLAIMPFSIGGDEGLSYLRTSLPGVFSDGLVAIPGLGIVSTNSTVALAEQQLTATQIGARLSATHVVEGDVRVSGDTLTIGVRLIDAATGAQIWADTVEGAPDQLPNVQGRMLRLLATALQTRLGLGRGDLADTRDVDPVAYDAYLRGLDRVFQRNEITDRQEAYRQLNRAISLEPDFAAAHAAKAYLLVHSDGASFGLNEEGIGQEIERAIASALEGDPDNILARAARVRAIPRFDGDIDAAIEAGEKLVADAPEAPESHYALSAVYFVAGRSTDALRQGEEAQARDPYNNIIRGYVANLKRWAGDYDEMARTMRNCADCSAQVQTWFYAMADHAEPYQFDRDRDDLLALSRQAGFPEFVIEQADAALRALIYERPYDGPEPFENYFGWAGVQLQAMLGKEEAAWAAIEWTSNTGDPSQVAELFYPGRLDIPDHMRRDPRYHAIFDHPVRAKILAWHKANGTTIGIPLSPEGKLN